MAKIHALITAKNGGMQTTLCAARGYQKDDNLNGLVVPKFFAYTMATKPEDCCEHCVKAMHKELPNTVKNAARNPEEYAKKHGF